jgi:hypothetical protein
MLSLNMEWKNKVNAVSVSYRALTVVYQKVKSVAWGRILRIYRVYPKCVKKSRGRFSHQNKNTRSSKHMLENECFFF